jgi:signal transduction histidine kinase
MKVISQELDRGELIEKVATSILWLYLFLFISIILINKFVLKNTWKPFYGLLSILNDFRFDKGTVQEPPKTKIKEFTMLNESVLNLLKTNAEIYNNQKQFIENASHELQTPLAIGINKLELLAGEKDQSPEQIQKIGEIIENFQRLSGLNKSLLLLSKIENKQFISKEELSIDEIFKRIVEGFSDYIEYRKIKIKYNIENDWILKINKDLIEILILNLVKNAIVHNRQGGELIIKLSSASFAIENPSDNPEIPSDKLFERFSKNSANKSSTGLGLAIVKAITDASELVISYSYNGNHVFKVSSSPSQ